jgi:polyisoprenoid-binding protein YceI
MRLSLRSRTAVRLAVTFGLCATAAALPTLAQQAGPMPLAFNSARVSIAGTSNIHEYTAATTTIRVTRAHLASAATADVWDHVLVPGVLDGFEVAIPAATLTSPKDGLDKNMHKALKVAEFPDITFRLSRLEVRAGVAGGYRAVGVLKIAGVERQITLDLKTERQGSALSVAGKVQFLMTDFGITPPTAMLGMLKTDPKITVSFETLVAIPLT